MKLGYLVAGLGLFASTLMAQERPNSSDFDLQNTFQRGQKEFALGGGIFFSPFVAIEGRPTVNYAGGMAQFGYMLNDLNENGPWHGNFELLAEGFAGGIFNGRGTYTASGTLWLRYNIVPSSCKLVPFVQLGGGVSMFDLDRQIFGQAFNFNLNAGLGARYFLNEHTSINAEYRFQHISNAGMDEHNLGINAQGATVSVSWYF
jgi:hypothetical protein